MTKFFVFTKSPLGTTVTSCANEEIAIKLCVYAIYAMHAEFAFYSR